MPFKYTRYGNQVIVENEYGSKNVFSLDGDAPLWFSSIPDRSSYKPSDWDNDKSDDCCCCHKKK